MGTTRLRLSQEKASLITRLTDDNVAKLLRILEDGQPYEIPQEETEVSYPATFRGGNPRNVFVVGDNHEPDSLPGYLEWCRAEQERWNCGTVVFIGDLANLASFSYHEKDPNLPGPAQELALLKQAVKKPFAMFENVKWMLGNHDLLLARKAFSAGLTTEMVRSLPEVLEMPDTWTAGMSYEQDNVFYHHGGSGGDAFRYAINSGKSTVQGHLHTRAFVQWSTSRHRQLFGMQVGCGIDFSKRTYDYARANPVDPSIGAGVVLEGKTAINLIMPR
jgi:hypothetical protein